MSILDSGNKDLIHIELVYKEKKKSNGFTKIIILSEEDGKKALLEQKVKLKEKKEKGEDVTPEDTCVKVLKTGWKTMLWGNQQKITSQCLVNTPQGGQDIDIIRHKDMSLKSCLVEWDIINDRGQPEPVTPDRIDMLPAHIVNELMNRYNEIIYGDDKDEEKN